MKAVNSEAKPVHGVAKAVELKVGDWSGNINLTIVPMDDFKVILGMDFFRSSKAIPMPYLGMVSIVDERAPCMVPVTQSDKGKETKVKTNSALQLTLG